MEKVKLTKKQRNFVLFLRSLADFEGLTVKVQNSDPQDWFLSHPYYHHEYQKPEAENYPLVRSEIELLQEFSLVEFGEVVLAKRNNILSFQGGHKHYKS